MDFDAIAISHKPRGASVQFLAMIKTHSPIKFLGLYRSASANRCQTNLVGEPLPGFLPRTLCPQPETPYVACTGMHKPESG